MIKKLFAKLAASWEGPAQTKAEEKFRRESELESSLSAERAQMAKERMAENAARRSADSNNAAQQAEEGLDSAMEGEVDLTEELDKLADQETSN